MKKLFSLLLVFAMVLSLCSCISSVPSKEEMISNAIELNWEKVNKERQENIVRAQNEYNDSIVKWTAKVYNINNGYVTMSNKSYNGVPIDFINVYLSNDDIAKLEKLQEVTVVGKLSISAGGSINDAFIIE